MTGLWQMPVAVAALLAWLASPPAGLADAARREAVRRQLTTPSASVYTNDTLPAARRADLAPESAPGFVQADQSQGQGQVETPGSIGPTTAPLPGVGDDEAAGALPPALTGEQVWRDRLAAAEGVLESDQLLVAGLQARVASLQAEFVARDDPAQRDVLAEDLTRTLAELERMNAKVEADRVSLDQLRDDARREGVPAGWLR